jgi:hypothetical protein
VEADVIRETLTAERPDQREPRDRSSERTISVQAPFASIYQRFYLHSLVLGAILFATLLAAWPGSRDILQRDFAAEPADGHRAAVALTISEEAIRPMEAVAASLVPEQPEPASEALPMEEPAAAIAVVEPETVADLPSEPPPEPEPAPEPIVAAGEALAQGPASQQASVESQPEPASALAPTDAPPLRVTAIGDSVMLAAAGDLALTISGIEINAEVGRPVSAALDILRGLYNAGQLGDVVVVHIGNNSPFSPSQFDEMMELMADVSRVVFVNLRVPRGWEDPNNAVLAEGVTRYPNAALADWFSASVDHPEFFLDGVHLRPEGVQAYAQLMAAYVGTP